MAIDGMLSTANVIGYLRARGVLPEDVAADVAELPGGISNTVLRVQWPGGAVVVKQSRATLRVAEVWQFDRRRILAESRCMRALGAILPAGTVPEVIDTDERELAFTMTCVPSGGVVWKDALLSGQVDLLAARRAGQLLAQVHRGSAGHGQLADQFADLMPLIEGRIDPYHLRAAEMHPDLAPLIEADIERLVNRRRALVLGDFSPKNLVVYPDRVLALDFEVAHWGDPAFDTAFMLTHLVAKAVHRRAAAAYLSAARVFWEAYQADAGSAGATEADTVTELGVLLLCRVDGKSSLEYFDADDRALVRALSRTLIRARESVLESVLDAVAGRLSGPSLADQG